MPLDQRGSDWMPLRGIDQRRLSDARLQAHYAVQWLVRFARAYVPAQPDDGHTNLGWDSALGGFTTHPLKDGTWLSLKITDLTLALHIGDGRTHLQSFSLDGCRDAQARRWLGEQLVARGLEAHALDAPSPYEMPYSLPRRGLWRGRLDRCLGRACGMVWQCRIFARLHPRTNDGAQIGGLARLLLAAPPRFRHFDPTPGAKRRRHRIHRRRTSPRRRIL